MPSVADYERERVSSESEAYRRSNRQAIAFSAAFYPAIRFVVVTGFIATLFFGSVVVTNNQLAVETYGFMVFIVQQLLWPFASLSQIMDEYQRAIASIKRVIRLLHMNIAIPTGNRLLPLKIVSFSLFFVLHREFIYVSIKAIRINLF